MNNESKSYSCITDFVNSMAEVYPNNKELVKYKRLLELTQDNEVGIKKHIQAFSVFYDNNPDFLVKRKFGSEQSEQDGIIFYSENVCLNIKNLWEKVEYREPIHKHLLTIFTVIRIGTDRCKEVLKQIKEQNAKKFPMPDIPNTNEGKFLTQTMNTIKDKIESNEGNPQAILGELLNGNFIQEFSNNLTSGIQDKEIDLNNLMSTVMGVFQKNAPGGMDISGILNNLNLGEMLSGLAPEPEKLE